MAKCPIGKKYCWLYCYYLKPTEDNLLAVLGKDIWHMACDYPYIGSVKAEPDKVLK